LDIEFKTARLKKTCEDINLATRKWGAQRGRTVIRRLNEIQSAECVADLGHTPPTRRHLLEPNHEGKYAVDVIHPFRLVFQAISAEGEPLGNVDPTQVTRVRILEVEDYHD
jgi:proteic killer suppression protein